MNLPMNKRRRPISKDWYKSKEAIILFALLGLIMLAALAGLAWLIVRHPVPALYAIGGLAAAAAAGYGICRVIDAVKWKKDMKRLDETAAALKQRELEKAGKKTDG